MQVFETQKTVRSVHITCSSAKVFLHESDSFKVQVIGGNYDISVIGESVVITPFVPKTENNSVYVGGSGNRVTRIVQNVSGNGNNVIGDVVYGDKINVQNNYVNQESTEDLIINVYTPKLETLYTTLKTSQLTSKTKVNSAYVDLSDSSEISLYATNIHAEINRSSNASFTCLGGVLNLEVKGCSAASAYGIGFNFAKVTLDVSGYSECMTSGIVKGDFQSKATGASRIFHTGRIEGNISRETRDVSVTTIKDR